MEVYFDITFMEISSDFAKKLKTKLQRYKTNFIYDPDIKEPIHSIFVAAP